AFCHLRAAQGVTARCASMVRKFEKCSVICAPRRSGWRVASVSYKDVSGRLCQWRVAQLHMARRAPSMFITR
ncbi:hypothetical protein A2U01_0065550, partial [Trifolium medium]|nr:hypothetical protein [Trifolium medium]